jgi:uncharacterized delta-60 repeat protein
MNACRIAGCLALVVAGAARAASGDLDATFGDYGRVRVELPGGEYGRREPLALQADGKIIVARTDPDGGINVARLNVDGSADAGFGTNGVAHFDFGEGRPASVRSVAVGSGGEIVVAGAVRAGPVGQRDMAVARLNPDGSLDAGFGASGRVAVDVSAGSDDYANDLVVQADGGILLAGGSAKVSDVYDIAFVRLAGSGILDPAFGSGGRVVLATPVTSAIARLLRQPDGKFVACGDEGDSVRKLLVVRITASGDRDITFGSNGVAAPFDSTWSFASASCALRPDGRIVVVGTGDALVPGDGNGVVVAQLTADGAADKSFDGDGIAEPAFGCAYACDGLDPGWFAETATDVLILEDGGLLVTGAGLWWELGVARLSPDGSPDTRFGQSASRLVDVGRDNHYASVTGTAAARLNNGGFLVVAGEPQQLTVVRIAADGGAGASLLGLASDGYTQEGRSPVTVWVRRTGSGQGAVSVDYATADGTAMAPADFVATRGTLTWSDGDTSPKPINVPVVDDSIAESAEYFQVKLSNSRGAGLATTTASVTIDAPDHDAIAFLDSTVRIPDDSGTVVLTVHRIESTDRVVSVHYETVSVKGSQARYTRTSGTLYWAAGDDAPKTIAVPIRANPRGTASTSFLVKLSNASGGADLAGTGVVTVYIDSSMTGSNSGGGGGAFGPGLIAMLALLYRRTSSAGVTRLRRD